MENNHDKNTQQHASYFHNGKEYKDIFEAAEAYVQEVLNQGKEDVNTQNPPPPNKTQTTLTHPHHKIKKVRSFLWGLLFGALISGISAFTWIYGYLSNSSLLLPLLFFLEIIIFIMRIFKIISKEIHEILKRFDIEGKTPIFLSGLILWGIIFGSTLIIKLSITPVIKFSLMPFKFYITYDASLGTLLKIPFIIEFLIFLPIIIIRILKKIDAILKRFGMERQAHFLFGGLLLVGGFLLGSATTAMRIKLEINNHLHLILTLLFVIGFLKIIIEEVIHYRQKFQRMCKKDKIIDLIGFGSITLYTLYTLYIYILVVRDTTQS